MSDSFQKFRYGRLEKEKERVEEKYIVTFLLNSFFLLLLRLLHILPWGRTAQTVVVEEVVVVVVHFSRH